MELLLFICFIIDLYVESYLPPLIASKAGIKSKTHVGQLEMYFLCFPDDVTVVLWRAKGITFAPNHISQTQAWRKCGLPYLYDVFIRRLALHKGWDVGNGSVHLYGDHFDGNGHGASGQNGRVDYLCVLWGHRKQAFMPQWEAGSDFPP